MLPKGLGGLGDMAGLMKHAMDIRNNMEGIKESLAAETIEASSGGGMVTVVANGHQEVISITIAPEVVDPEDVEMLEDLVLAAVNEARRKSQEVAAGEMEKVTGGMQLPGMFG